MKFGENGKQEKIVKTFYDVESLDRCKHLADNSVGVDAPANFKWCEPGKQCTEHYTRGGPDLKPGECRVGSGKLLPATNDGSYGGVVIGIDCKQSMSPSPPPPVQFSPTVFKNLAGENILMFANSNLGACLELCRQNTQCRGINFCRGDGPKKECAGGTPENRCDLKTFSEGEPSYYPDTTATSGDGYMSQYVTSRDAPKEPK